MNYFRLLSQGLLAGAEKIGDYLSILSRGLMGFADFVTYRATAAYTTISRSPHPYSLAVRLVGHLSP